jgi:Cd2+/Zn2+-exporting ATPase
MVRHKSSSVPPGWETALAHFLNRSAGVEAVHVDAEQQRIQLATLGPIDPKALEAYLRATLQQVEAVQEEAPPPGIVIRATEDGWVQIHKPSCPTAPLLWRWREVAWPVEPVEAVEPSWQALVALAGCCAVLGILGWCLGQFEAVPTWLPITLFIGGMLAGGWDALQDVREGLPKGELDIHFLMIAVALGAASIGAWAEGTLLLFLFSFSGAMEAFALCRTRNAINSLLHAAPQTATILDRSGHERTVPVAAVEVGEMIVVRPGELFPVDASVCVGQSAADESNLTGEANPVGKQVGDTVYSGTLNLWGSVQAQVMRRATDSALQKVIHLIREAQHLKAPSQQLTDRFGTRYTLTILSLTTAMFFVWWLGFEIPAFYNTEILHSAFYRAMTLLVVASPCALVLSIPSAILAAIASGARHGILFRGGAAIEKLAEVDLVALDKTGTLTTGEMRVDSVESFPPGREVEAATLAYSLESYGSHPIARAIQRYGKAEGLRRRAIDHFKAMSGKGVRGRDGEALCVLGRRELLEEGPLSEWIRSVPEPPPEYIENWIFKDDLIARILLKDQIRAESKATLQVLKQEGMRTVMLTGDRRGAAQAVALELGIDELRFGLKPADKVQAIRAYSESGYKVAMVGDGVNDAPSLAAAYVSVAMGVRGSDAALEQSEVVLMEDRIDRFMDAVALSVRVRRIIRQNLVIALSTVVLMALAAMGGWLPLSAGVFAHEGSTVIVCLNSLRLLTQRGFLKSDRKVEPDDNAEAQAKL